MSLMSSIASPVPPDDDTSVTLGSCLTALGPHVLRAEHTPAGLDTRVGELVVGGSDEAVPAVTGGIFLHVGPVSAERAPLLVTDLATAEFVALVVKERGTDLAALIEASAGTRLALLVAAEATPWRHLVSLLSAAAETPSSGPGWVSSPGTDLFTLANLIASSVGGAATIEDTRGTVLAYSTVPGQLIDDRRLESILGLHTPQRAQNTNEYRAVVEAGGRAVRFDFPEPTREASRLAAAVLAGNEPLGVVFVLDQQPPLGPEASELIEEAARLTAMHLVRARAQRDSQRWASVESLRSLLDGTASESSVAIRLGGLARTSTTVLAIGGISSVSRTAEIVATYCASWNPESVAAAVGEVVYALLPTGQAGADRIQRLASDVAATVDRVTGRLPRVAIGPVSASLSEVAHARRVADHILNVLLSSAETPAVADLDAVRAKVVLAQLAQREYGLLVQYDGPVDQLLAHDAERGTSYAPTLLAYLESSGKTDTAGSKMMVHENTVRYRVRRMKELFELPLDDPDERLVTWLRLRLLASTPRS